MVCDEVMEKWLNIHGVIANQKNVGGKYLFLSLSCSVDLKLLKKDSQKKYCERRCCEANSQKKYTVILLAFGES